MLLIDCRTYCHHDDDAATVPAQRSPSYLHKGPAHEVSWRRAAIPEWVFRSIGAGCSEAVVGFSRLGSVLAEDMIRVAEIGAQAESGEPCGGSSWG